MLSIVMFAIIGALIDAPAGYWITYGILAGLKLVVLLAKEVN